MVTAAAADLLAQSEQEEWLPIRTVASKLAVSHRLVRKWIHAGQFDEVAVFSPRVIRISVASYQRFVKKSRAG